MPKYDLNELLESSITPMMKQYLNIKINNQDCILFYRLGDFYEMFFDDAITASRELELTLTGRDCGLPERAPMCGVPYHAMDGYIAKLVAKGYKVAICEQLEDPSTAKGIVKRDIIRVVTPGTVTDPKMLDETKNNYLASMYREDVFTCIIFADVTTGELTISPIIVGDDLNKLYSEISKFSPSEILVNAKMASNQKMMEEIRQRFVTTIDVKDDSFYQFDKAVAAVEGRFGKKLISEKGIAQSAETVLALYALLDYLEDTQKNELKHINDVECVNDSLFMEIDLSTKRNLELTETMREKKKKGSLLWVLDDTRTSMGARLLRHFIDRPLASYNLINERLNAVEELFSGHFMRDGIRETLSGVNDIERLASKISFKSANGRDLVSLKNSLKCIPALKETIIQSQAKMLQQICCELDPLEDVTSILDMAIVDDPPFTVREGGIIKDGYHDGLTELRRAMREGKDWIAQVEQEEKEKTGIKNLKVGYNKVFGYFLEVTKSYQNLVPDYFIRKQTLANCERYITPKLKEIENVVLGAEEKSVALEYEIFCQVRDVVYDNMLRIQKTARAVAKLDFLQSLANVAYKNNYTKPIITNDGIISIKNGRHPVVEKMLTDSLFVPNDTLLNLSSDNFAIITGPNMAGKSTYMRQVALIVLMAHLGSFVPADSAAITIVDKIFTRVGASDDLASGQSTFMVEMNEVSNILKNATENSLLILDEIGRGTSTFDGLSIAWSVVEYITKKIGAKTLFATHYHELTVLEERLKGVKNYSIAVKKRGDDITFLRKIVDGGTDDSFGIQVAKIAGVPSEVIRRAKEVVKVLELNEITFDASKVKKEETEEEQLDLTQMYDNEIIKELQKLDVTTLTPIEALNKLFEFSKMAKKI